MPIDLRQSISQAMADAETLKMDIAKISNLMHTSNVKKTLVNLEERRQKLNRQVETIKKEVAESDLPDGLVDHYREEIAPLITSLKGINESLAEKAKLPLQDLRKYQQLSQTTKAKVNIHNEQYFVDENAQLKDHIIKITKELEALKDKVKNKGWDDHSHKALIELDEQLKLIPQKDQIISKGKSQHKIPAIDLSKAQQLLVEMSDNKQDSLKARYISVRNESDALTLSVTRNRGQWSKANIAQLEKLNKELKQLSREDSESQELRVGPDTLVNVSSEAAVSLKANIERRLDNLHQRVDSLVNPVEIQIQLNRNGGEWNKNNSNNLIKLGNQLKLIQQEKNSLMSSSAITDIKNDPIFTSKVDSRVARVEKLKESMPKPPEKKLFLSFKKWLLGNRETTPESETTHKPRNKN